MKTYPLHIITIQHPDMLTEKQVRRVVGFADGLLQTVGVKLKVLSWHTSDIDPDPYSEPFQMSGAYRSAYLKLNIPMPCHLLIPPIIVGRYKFFGGVGGCVCCEKGNRVSASSAFLSETISSLKVVDKLYSCAAIMVHELSHVMGLHHKPFVNPDGTQEPGASTIPANLMHPVVNMYSGHRGLKFLPGSKKLIRECLSK